MSKALNDISVLIDKILEEAKGFSEQIKKTAETEAQNTLARYKDQAQAEAAKITDTAQAQAEAIARRAQSQGGIEERNLILTARRSLIDSTFAKAYDRLCALPEAEKIDFLVRLATASQTAADAQMVFNKADAALGQKVVEQVNKANQAKGIKLTLDPQAGNFGGGFILREGSVETNCTFEVLVKNIQPRLEAEIAALLLG